VTEIAIEMTVNGERRTGVIDARKTLADFLRDDLELTGTHLGCEHGVCGACTVLLDGASARSCLTLAAQANGHEVTTVEGLAPPGAMHAIQEACWEEHSFQCGFCTPGFLITAYELLQENTDFTEDELREALSGNLCRCTGYQSIVAGVMRAARMMATEKVGD
jgi:carbon-monoxide dehydrogenase small subunit